MSKISERAQKILLWIRDQNSSELPIRQQMLAELFDCSRRTIGRALDELKAAGLLIDLNKRHENRCKLYRHCEEPRDNDVATLTPAAKHQWDLYQKTFAILFKEPQLNEWYREVTWALPDVREEMELWKKTFAGLYAMRVRKALC